MTRKMISFLSGILFLFACNNEARTKTTAEDTNQIVAKDNPPPSNDTVPAVKVGDDADEHGCKASAGYQWSMIRKECIRLFESGIKMEPKDPALDKTTVAYLLFSDDRVRVEIFLPTQKKSVVIRKSSAVNEPEQWVNGPLGLKLQDGVYSLYDEAKLIYQGASK